MSVERFSTFLIGFGLVAGISFLLLLDLWRGLHQSVRSKFMKLAGLTLVLAAMFGVPKFLASFARPCGGGRLASSARNLHAICSAMHLYADDPRNGKYPADLNPTRALLSLYHCNYLTDCRLFIAPGRGSDSKYERLRAALAAGEVPMSSDVDYVLVQGCRQTDREYILVYEKHPRDGQRSFARVDGRLESLPEQSSWHASRRSWMRSKYSAYPP